MNTVPIHLRLPRTLHDQALALQAEEQKHTDRRVKLAPVLVDLISAGIRASATQERVDAALLELQSAPTTEDGSSIAAAVRDRAVAALKGEGKS